MKNLETVPVPLLLFPVRSLIIRYCCLFALFKFSDDAVQGDDFLSVVPDGKFGSYEVNNQCLSGGEPTQEAPSGGEPTQEAPTGGSVNLSFSLLTVIGFLLASLLA